MKNKTKIKTEKRLNRHRRVRSKVQGTALRPRLAVFKSNNQISAQIIDDSKARTLVANTSLKAEGKTPAEKAFSVGVALAKEARSKKILKVVFDRGGYIFTGNIKKLAEGARAGGLEF
ncbi:50S ribosomal protein L18 [Candidatus Campbellbacteria bacterium CG11_big_fil_rev_8_21_14_0_20_44_21]|uniref:Large ribosomal subunit protein uL18 n=1 Tax=Candidatus Campbellbacteria bacterium CG22_combo_CG10-13_8_21_14_all_43_18 TaxID=1974530 RepID=A0A2H0DWH8_9BACT|nr:MAG: 50S ribosomal protein L18 [Candidatus Campbellbacteria bacterium CG22_combo_CG10-13_8_21_14_all_43_18]PIR24347.1 MAG: 50S ribosomal protein L18 [Candidatus Campbellbacteria bacterium CG11_big_fil_rev_8_21_14_0_20_44_21]